MIRHRPEKRHCGICYVSTSHRVREERKGPSEVHVTATCRRCGHSLSWTRWTEPDPRYDEDAHNMRGIDFTDDDE